MFTWSRSWASTQREILSHWKVAKYIEYPINNLILKCFRSVHFFPAPPIFQYQINFTIKLFWKVSPIRHLSFLNNRFLRSMKIFMGKFIAVFWLPFSKSLFLRRFYSDPYSKIKEDGIFLNSPGEYLISRSCTWIKLRWNRTLYICIVK